MGLTGCRLGFVAWLADVDAALEEGAVFDGDAGGDDVAGEGAFAADVDAIGGLAVAADFTENDDLAGADVGGYLAVAADGDAVAGEVDGAFDFAVDVERFRTGDLAFNYQALADGGLFAVGNCTGSGGRCARTEGRCRSRRSRTHWLWSRGRVARLVWFPHRGSYVPFGCSFPRGRGLVLVAVVAPMDCEIQACGTALAPALRSRYYFVIGRVLWSSLWLRLESYPPRLQFCDREMNSASELLVGVVVLFYERDGAYYVVGDGLGAGELQGGAHGDALPDGGGADGVGRCFLGPGSEEFVDDGFAGAELGDDGDDSAFGGGGDAAVGCVVAEPNDVGDEGIEVGEVEGGDVAADAVDHEPGAGLPGPANGLGGEGVVNA